MAIATKSLPSLLGTDATPHNLGGRLCLSFVNTLWWRRSFEPIEQLTGYDDVVAAVDRAGWLPDPDALRRDARVQPQRAVRALRDAVELRECLADVLTAVATGQAPVEAQTRQIMAFAAPGLAGLSLSPTGDRRFRAQWRSSDLALPARQVAVSAVLLLTGPELASVKRCDGPTCGWVFLDTSRNQTRRWCDSRECGNRERVRAHYVRTQVARTRPSRARG